MVAPTGFEPVFESRSRFRQVSYAVTDQQHPATSTRLKHAAESSLKHPARRAMRFESCSTTMSKAPCSLGYSWARWFAAHSADEGLRSRWISDALLVTACLRRPAATAFRVRTDRPARPEIVLEFSFIGRGSPTKPLTGSSPRSRTFRR